MRPRYTTFGALLAAFVTATSSSGIAAQDLLIRGAKVYTLAQSAPLENADVLVREGRIVAVGKELAATPGATIVDARGRPLTPGFFGGLSDISVDEITAAPETVDSQLDLGTVQEPHFRPEFDITLAFNRRSITLAVARIEGLTWTVLAPTAGGSIVAGQGAGVTLDARKQPILEPSRSLFIDLGSDTAALAGGSRAAQFMLLDQAIRELHTPPSGSERALLYRAGREALGRYLKGGRLLMHVDRAADISRAIAFARGNGFQPVIVGGAESWLVADELAAARAAVILDPLVNLPASFDTLGARLDNAALLHRAGVLIAFSMSYGTAVPSATFETRKVRQLAGNAVAQGLDWSAALAALTVNPARIFGLDDSRGTLAVGKVADLVLWSGDPLEVTSAADQVWIDGRAVEMRSRQTRLRDRYAPGVREQ